jgi:uncharacterized protein YegP (UPF0339 family)
MNVHKVEVFAGDGWCWRAVARNGKILFRASETYINKKHTVKQAKAVAKKFKAKLIFV